MWKMRFRQKNFPSGGNFYMGDVRESLRAFLHLFRSAHVNELTNFGNVSACLAPARFSLLFIRVHGSEGFGIF